MLSEKSDNFRQLHNSIGPLVVVEVLLGTAFVSYLYGYMIIIVLRCEKSVAALA